MPGTNPDPAILVFAKAPVAGQVKTRLIPLLGADGAAALHRQLLAHALTVARSTTANAGTLELWCAPDTTHPHLQTIAAAHGAALHRQLGNDLGARMAHAFANALKRNWRAICIGADCPMLTARHLHEADAELRNGNDAVFVPAEDGGYALVGLAHGVPDIFDGIAWGGPQVMAETRERMRAAGMRWQELETLWDVDRPEDLQRLHQSGWHDHAPVAD
ncbi:MAG: TIGR04282 family arsenosugar biosynthesis glycosyltransferase [Burkholderiales bacterium]